MRTKLLWSFFVLSLITLRSFGQTEIHASQVAYDSRGPKLAVIKLNEKYPKEISFSVQDVKSSQSIYTGVLSQGAEIESWFPGRFFYKADFSSVRKAGEYQISLTLNGVQSLSAPFRIEENALVKLTLPAIISYYNHQRANTPEELGADIKIKPKGSERQVDMRGGWADASGDISKYFSHLAYANFMSPQQIPLVTWSLASTSEGISGMLGTMGLRDSIRSETLYGADYMMRALSPEGYFYMIIFSHFKKDPAARDIVGLLANSVTTTDYQSAFREGGGMAIASLARVSQWKQNGDFSAEQYLEAAKKAFDHLLLNNSKYTDDGKDNIIDDYCALMAATELWIATDLPLYRDEARKRAENLNNRMSSAGYFIADDADRPFWHASDAGMPVVALSRYLDKEKDESLRKSALSTIKSALDYNLKISNAVPNPFGYARQSFKYQGKVMDGFFIPHENETGWWWQGENARLGSLATAALLGGRLVYPAKGNWGITKPLAEFVSQQLSWVLGANPYNMCFMYGFGKNNVPYMEALFGHGSQKGGISNGITGADGKADGSGIDFRLHANGNEWRWTEQWIPHAAWFLQAIAVMAEEPKIN